MNRRDLLKTLMAMLPASWCAKTGAVESASTMAVHPVRPHNYVPTVASQFVEVIAGEDIMAGRLAAVSGGRAFTMTCWMLSSNVLAGVATHHANCGEKVKLQVSGCAMLCAIQ